MVELTQSGFRAIGTLLDFSPVAFRIRVKPEPCISFHWFNPDEAVHIHIERNKQILFSGRCKCIRQQDEVPDREMVLTSVDKTIKRFNKKRTRNRRQNLAPPPILTFDHPFLKKRVLLGVSDISTSGFCVFEDAERGFLFPGMIIPKLTINFAGAFKVPCSAQVIYRMEENDNDVRCGLAILDMDITSYSRLADILINSMDTYAHVSNEVDLDALWEFFFDSGFIYPAKYAHIQSSREIFKETYRKLYQGDFPEIARHFIYQKDGRIYGHLSMVRAYEKTWLTQHFAARTMGRKRPGFNVLRQIIYFVEDGRRLPSLKMDYLLSYFRLDNKFPERIFGDFARDLNNPGECSMDTFAYLPFSRVSDEAKLPENWSLRERTEMDLDELNRWYTNSSRGLLLDALCLGQDDTGYEFIEKLYSRCGFMRKCVTYSLSQGRDLNAVLIVNQSASGINLSDLLNAITILVINPDGLTWNILHNAVSLLAEFYGNMRQVPVLIYPVEYAAQKNIPYERQYHLWILNLAYSTAYTEYMRKRFRVGF